MEHSRAHWTMQPVFRPRKQGITCARASMGCLVFVALAGWGIWYLMWGRWPEPLGALLPMPPLRDTVFVLQKPLADTLPLPPAKPAAPTFQRTARSFFANTRHIAELAPGDRLFLERRYAAAADFYQKIVGPGLVEEAEWRLLLVALARCPSQKAAFQRALSSVLKQKNHPHHAEALRLQTAADAIFQDRSPAR